MKSRGFRNNNPLNIVHSSDKFVGEVKGSDRVFKTFKSEYYGYRAAVRILRTYYNKHDCKTIESIIRRWSATDQIAYISYVCNRVRIHKGFVLPDNYTNPLVWTDIIQAMAEFENGVKIVDNTQIYKAVINCVF